MPSLEKAEQAFQLLFEDKLEEGFTKIVILGKAPVGSPQSLKNGLAGGSQYNFSPAVKSLVETIFRDAQEAAPDLRGKVIQHNDLDKAEGILMEISNLASSSAKHYEQICSLSREYFEIIPHCE